ncbi:PEPxxWA-CTERM sorting domain-containing protein [Sphingomonas sp. AP4-R1]|uniref:PEPxxWA-CTERM sorting domain-containing protein n=1 Tax=Sphingomonas sp. AP4-R1 TaxID=2735134 RepID=UPI001493D3AA|nr:PEPxxWA-CTERM sorting domain-containing protein [Sphingomonas sp. AP4-R1]QJU59878.1 PEPxxWA-CTERM sorting domain-containing protein [Sphingomonas sp. AP4-R1]
MKLALTTALVALASLAASAGQAATFTVTIPDATTFHGKGDASVTYDGVIFSTSSALGGAALFTVGSDADAVPPIISAQQSYTGIPNILMTLPEMAVSVTLSYGTLLHNPVTFLLSDGRSFVQDSTSLAYRVTDVFSATGSIRSILFTTTDPTLNIGAITYTTAEATNAPEPATWAMFIGGFGLVGTGMRRQRLARTRAI